MEFVSSALSLFPSSHLLPYIYTFPSTPTAHLTKRAIPPQGIPQYLHGSSVSTCGLCLSPAFVFATMHFVPQTKKVEGRRFMAKPKWWPQEESKKSNQVPGLGANSRPSHLFNSFSSPIPSAFCITFIQLKTVVRSALSIIAIISKCQRRQKDPALSN